MINKKITIAVDGFSSCGKSTLAKSIAKILSYAYIDTGAMYRCVSLYCIRKGYLPLSEESKKKLISDLKLIEITFQFVDGNEIASAFLNGENVEKEIRGLEVSQNVSNVSTIKEVRHFLVSQQQNMGVNGGIVMDGRDIGTVVFPKAELKIFMTASENIRAQRRYKEMIEKGEQITIDEIIQNLYQRDHLDQTREESPLKKAENAIVLDNSFLTPEQQTQWVLERVKDLTKINV